MKKLKGKGTKAIVLLLLLCICCPACGKEKRDTYAIILKAKNNPYNEAAAKGFKEAVEAAGNKCIIEYPDNPTAEEQIVSIKRAISQKVKAIAVAANDADALSSILNEAMEKGIHVTTLDSDTNISDREIFVNQASAEEIGRVLLEAVYDMSGGKGQWAILSTTSQASNQNMWIDEMKKAMQEPKYSELRLVNIVYGMDEYVKSAEKTRKLLEEYPNLKVICAPTVVGLYAAAATLDGREEAHEVKVTGLGMPQVMYPYTDDVCPYFYLWSPRLLGQVSAGICMDLVGRKITGTVGETSYLEGYGEYRLVSGSQGGTEVIVGALQKYHAGNVDDWINE